MMIRSLSPRLVGLTGAIALALALLAPLAPARAATVTYSLVLPTAATDNPTATSTAGAGAMIEENKSGTVSMRQSPWDAQNSTLDPDDAGSVYSALYNSGGAMPVSATFDFGDVSDHLSLVWGSAGRKNSLKLFLGSTLAFDMSNDPTADENLDNLIAMTLVAPGVRNSVLVKISGVLFDRMVIGADHRAFEFANLQTAAVVPVPAGGLMLVTALGGLALLRRRTAA